MSNDYPTIFGIGRTFIKNDSLSSDFEKDDFLLTKNSDKYNVGDMVVYETLEGDILTDRITKITDNEKYFFEHSNDTDMVVFSDSIKGNVILTIPGIAPYIEWIESTYGTIVILMSIILIIEIPHFIDLINQRKKEKTQMKY